LKGERELGVGVAARHHRRSKPLAMSAFAYFAASQHGKFHRRWLFFGVYVYVCAGNDASVLWLRQ